MRIDEGRREVGIRDVELWVNIGLCEFHAVDKDAAVLHLDSFSGQPYEAPDVNLRGIVWIPESDDVPTFYIELPATAVKPLDRELVAVTNAGQESPSKMTTSFSGPLSAPVLVCWPWMSG